MHNGLIREFATVNGDLEFAVDPSLYAEIEGTTDTEVFFHLALTFGLGTTRPAPSSARSGSSRRRAGRTGSSTLSR